MKKFLSVASLITLILVLTSCRSIQFNGSRTGNDSQFLMEYTIFNGTDSQVLQLDQGDLIDGEIVIDGGKLSIKIQKENEEPIYETENIFFSNTIQVEAEEAGDYKITVTGKKAKGKISFVKHAE